MNSVAGRHPLFTKWGQTVTAFQQLIDNLEQCRVQYAELVALGEQKKDRIINNEIEALTELLSKENRVLNRLAEFERACTQQIAAYQQELGLQPLAAATLDDLIRMTVKEADKRRLEDARRSLAEVTQSLRTLNETNQLLVRQSLDFINYSLDLFTVGPEDDMVYQAPAQHNATVQQRRGMFDTRA